MKKTIIFLIILLTPLLFAFQFPTQGQKAVIDSSFPEVSQINATDVLPLLNVSNPVVEKGNAISILVGLVEKSNVSSFVSGIPFHLWLLDIERNQSRSLVNQTTTEGFYNYTLETYFTSQPLDSGTYLANVAFNVSGEVVTTNASFQIVLDPDARVIFQPSYTLIDFIQVGENLTISLKIENVGASNAFNVSVSLQSIDEPVGLIASQFPLRIPLISPEELVVFNFTVAPSRFGIGRLSFITSYSNSEGISKVGTTNIVFRILPRLTASFSPNNELFSGNLTTFQIRITNLEQANFTISYVLSSDLISFFSDIETNKQTILAGATLTQSVSGAVLKDGLATVTLRVVFFDQDGNEAADVLIITQTFSISTSPINIIINQSPATLLFILNLLILISLLGTVIVLYLKPDLRNRMLRRFMAPSIPEYELDTDTVIVDGSNVAWEKPDSSGRADLANIDKAVESLKQAGFKEIIVIADAALRYQVSNKEEFDRAAKKGKIHVMPAKVSADHFILRLAKERNAMILTNDLFREFRDQQEDIDNKRIPFTIFKGRVYLHPLGKVEDRK